MQHSLPCGVFSVLLLCSTRQCIDAVRMHYRGLFQDAVFPPYVALCGPLFLFPPQTLHFSYVTTPWPEYCSNGNDLVQYKN